MYYCIGVLCGIEAPTDFISKDADPTLSAAQKLAIIDAAQVSVVNADETSFMTKLPFTAGAVFWHSIFDDPNRIFSDYVNVGDSALYKSGIGSRLVSAAIRYQLEANPRLDKWETGWARLGLINTAIKVFGQENVAVMQKGRRFGWQAHRPLEEVFDLAPFEVGKPYLVYEIEAHIDHERACSWELPILQTATQAS